MGEDNKELTDKQKLSLVVIGAAKSVHAGVMECVRQKIVSRDWFYRHWLKQPAYVEAMNAERDRLQGEIRTRVANQLLANVEDVLENLIAHAKSSRGDSPRCAEIVLGLLGFDTGRGNRVNVNTSVSQQTDNQKKFNDRLFAAIDARKQKIEDGEVEDVGTLTEDTSKTSD